MKRSTSDTSLSKPPLPPSGPRQQFRWELLLIPLALLLGPWFLDSCDAPVHWRNAVEALHVRSPMDYSATVSLAAVLVAVLIVLRLTGRRPSGD